MFEMMFEDLSKLLEKIYRAGLNKTQTKTDMQTQSLNIQAWNLKFYLQIPITPEDWVDAPKNSILIPGWKKVANSYPVACGKLLEALKEEVEDFWYHSQVLDGLQETCWKKGKLKSDSNSFISPNLKQDPKINSGSGRCIQAELGLWETGIIILSHHRVMKCFPLECPKDEIRSNGQHYTQIPVFRRDEEGKLGCTSEVMRQCSEEYYCAVHFTS